MKTLPFGAPCGEPPANPPVDSARLDPQTAAELEAHYRGAYAEAMRESS